MKKKVVLSVLLVVMLSIVSMSACFAMEKVPNLKQYVPMRMTHINVFLLDINVDESGDCNCVTYVDSRNTDRIKIAMYLQKNSGGSWVNVKSWIAYKDASSMTLNKSTQVDTSYDYRVKSYVYVYYNGQIVESSVQTVEQ